MNKKEVERLVGLLQHISLIVFPAKAFVRRFELLIYDPKRKYGQNIKLDRFILEEIDWWIEILTERKYVRASYDFLLKDPAQADLHIWTDAASTIGVGGKMGKYAFQVNWDATRRKEILRARPGWDIQSDELLGSLVALKLFAPMLTGKSVTLYNDNPGAAHAIISKAPRLHRQDLQFMIREIAKLAIEYKFYFWGFKVDGSENDDADALSRFKLEDDYDWNKRGFEMLDASSIVDEYMLGLKRYPRNFKPGNFQWDPTLVQKWHSVRKWKKSHFGGI